MSTLTCDGHLWLKDFLPQALEKPSLDYANGPKDLKAVRVMTFGYDANVFTKAASRRSFTFAEDLLSQLKDSRGGEAVYWERECCWFQKLADHILRPTGRS